MPVLTVGNDVEFPNFYSRHSGFWSPHRVTSEREVARAIGDLWSFVYEIYSTKFRTCHDTS